MIWSIRCCRLHHSELLFNFGLFRLRESGTATFGISSATSNHLSKLIILNNKLIRILQNKSTKTHNSELYKEYLYYPSAFVTSLSRAAAIPRTRTQFGRRAFSVCGPDVWNSLPSSVRTVDSKSSFRRARKTRLFQLAFNN